MNFSNLFRKKTIAAIQRDAALGYGDHGTPEEGGTRHLRRTLGVVDLTALGIAAIIGAGIFSMIGKASFNGGPAVTVLFVFTAIACAFAMLCYAEFASAIPIAGSAYTYAYASFGELIAWIIGWDLLMEYAIGNIAVAISWSDYFTGLMASYGYNIPTYLTMDFLTASRGFSQITELLNAGNTIEAIRGMEGITPATIEAYTAWATAPRVAGLPLICDLPALAIVIAITALVYIGIRESKRVSNVMVALKIAVILIVIIVGAYYVNPDNWTPFAPNGASGVLKGVAAVFFAYIGFDALTTTAEECRDPQRDLPRGMILSLLICTVLYILIALVLTGMVNYSTLDVGDPLARVFGPEGVNIPWIERLVAVSAVIAIATVLLVFQLGQPRIWMAMSRDGLLPKIFSSIHPRFKTPWFSTIITGIFVAVPALFMNLTEVTELGAIGTLFAFLLVCGGVLMLNRDNDRASEEESSRRRFRVPYVNGKFIVPALLLILAFVLYRYNYEGMASFFSDFNAEKFPMWVFILFALTIAALTFIKNLSLIPVLGLLTCGYLMTELGITNWTRFGIWLVVGLILYFLYGFTHSKLKAAEAE
jgi:basic amino acid/polyamine antiporter, APA family